MKASIESDGGMEGGKKGKKGKKGAALERVRSPSIIKAEAAIAAAQVEQALSMVHPGRHTSMPVPAVVNTIMVQAKGWFECDLALPRLRRFEVFGSKTKFTIAHSIFAPRAQETDSGIVR
jgi:hypothetical protein